jgi:hypothetical protein
LTLSQWEALEARRTIRLNHERFNTSVLAAMYYNAHAPQEAEKLTAFDFVPGFQRTQEEIEEEKRVTSLKQAVQAAYLKLGYCTPDKIKRHRARMLKRLEDAGVPGAAEFIAEVFK